MSAITINTLHRPGLIIPPDDPKFAPSTRVIGEGFRLTLIDLEVISPQVTGIFQESAIRLRL
jgi:hypothetical protein